MKPLVVIATLLLAFGCKNEQKPKAPLYPKVAQTPEQLGKEIFEGKGNCVACHQADQKVVGPSIAQIAETYKHKNASIVAFLKEESEPIVDPEQYSVMKTNFVLTKAMSDEELNGLEAYIHSFSK